MSLQAGTLLGPYRILAPLGAGGMGEVYRASDTRLDREVAIKVVPKQLARDPVMLARFEREARAVAAVSDPNILAIFDVGTAGGITYAVMELLEGETLRVRLDRGTVPEREAIEIAAAIADGLAAAHARGIVHRDIKPENVFLTRPGGVKIIDFGLACTRDLVPGQGETIPGATLPGTVLGTVGYMAPEQVAGHAADARSDIFSLGCILYELLAGRRAFALPTAAETLTAILRHDPPPLQAGAGGRRIAPALARIVGRCLAKAADQRFQSARDLAFTLRGLTGASDESASLDTGRRSTRRFSWAWAMVVPALLAAGWIGSHMPRTAVEPAAGPTAIALPVENGRPFSPALSPDGKYVAYLQDIDDQVDVWVRFLAGGPPSNLTTQSGLVIQRKTLIGGLDISPDGSLIAVRAWPLGAAQNTGGIYVIPAPLGGPPRKLVANAIAMRWSPDGGRVAFIRAGMSAGDALVIAQADGTSEQVLVPAAGGIHIHQPAWSHDGAYVYFARSFEIDNTAPTEVWRVPSRGGEPERVLATEGVAFCPMPLASGEAIIYAGDRPGEGLNLWWRPLAGGPERRLTTGAGAFIEPRASADGRRVVCTAQRLLESLAIIDAAGTDQAGPFATLTGRGAGDSEPSRAPRREAVVFQSRRSGVLNLWRTSPEGGAPRQVTVGPAGDHHPSASPDGRQVAFISARGGRRAIWIASVDGGAPRMLVEGAVLNQISWSPDGTRIMYAVAGREEPSLWIASLDGKPPERVPGVSGALPAWSPTADLIVYAARSGLRFMTSTGQPLPIDVRFDLTLASRFAWSDDGRMLALTSAPGSNMGEVWVMDMGPPPRTRRVALLPSRYTLNGVAWLADSRSLVVGLVDHDNQILLLDGVR